MGILNVPQATPVWHYDTIQRRLKNTEYTLKKEKDSNMMVTSCEMHWNISLLLGKKFGYIETIWGSIPDSLDRTFSINKGAPWNESQKEIKINVTQEVGQMERQTPDKRLHWPLEEN